MRAITFILGLVLVACLVLAFGREGKPCERNTMTQEQLDELWRQRAERWAEDARRHND